jgi:UDP-N-acetyl-2-amino-2-deoxyglucuronate dehydrogenase
LCVRALEAGKHVVVEKPLDVTMDAASHVVDAQRRTGGTLTVISEHRFDPASLAVHEAIRLGRLGRLTSGLASVPWWRSQAYYDSADWRGTRALDGGALLNQGIHTIDLLVWFLGIPMEVSAWTGRLAHERIEVEDTAVATLRFAGGALGVLHAATSAYPGLSSRLQIHGDKGSAVIDADQLTYLHASEPPEPTPVADDQAGVETSRTVLEQGPPGAAPPAAHPTNGTSLRAQYRDFLSAVQRGHQPLVTAHAAARTLSVVDAIYRSAATGLPAAIQPVDTDAPCSP